MHYRGRAIDHSAGDLRFGLAGVVRWQESAGTQRCYEHDDAGGVTREPGYHPCFHHAARKPVGTRAGGTDPRVVILTLLWSGWRSERHRKNQGLSEPINRVTP